MLVFLLAGPATNLATMGVIQREMGMRTLVLYLAGISVSSILMGLATDWMLSSLGLSVEVLSIQETPELLSVIAILSGLILLVTILASLMRQLRRSQPESISG